MSTFLRLGLAMGLCLSVGCASPPAWRVVSQARPNPLTASTLFVVQEPTLDGARIDGTPVDTLAEQAGAQRAAWIYSLERLGAAFRGSVVENSRGLTVLREPASSPAYTIQARIVRIETARPDNTNEDPHTDVEAKITLVDPAGRPVDEIDVSAKIEAIVDSQVEERRTERLQKAGMALGKAVSTYLRTRTGLD